MTNTVLADSGYWLALSSRTDNHHDRAKEVTLKNRAKLVVTWPVLTEASHLIAKKVSVLQCCRFLGQVKAYSTVFELTVEDIGRCQAMMEKYSDLPMDLADASLVVAAEKLGSGDIFSTDLRDFKTYRWKNRHPFKNLMYPEK